jgi:hypothetical protein
LTARPTIFLAVALSAGVLAAGCGDSDDEGSSSTIATSTLSKAQFVKKANVGCERLSEQGPAELSAYEKSHPVGEESEGRWYAGLTKTVVLPLIESEIALIREMGAPAGDEERIEAFLDAEEAAIDEVAGLKELASFREVEERFGPSSRLGRSYGIISCTHGGSFESPAGGGT